MAIKKILQNASYLFISDVLLRIITALVTILIARYLGAHDYGIISLALAFSAIAGFFTDIGLTQTLTREATKPNANMEVLMSSYFRAKIVLSIITCFGAYFIIHFMYSDPAVRSIVSWVVYPTIIGSALFGPGVTYFQVLERMKVTAALRFTQGTFTALSLLLAFFFRWPVEFVAPIYGFSNIVVGIFSFILLMRELKFYYGWDREVVRGIYSFTINGLVIMTIPQLGPLIIEKVATLKDVGFFAAAYRIPVLLYQVPGVIAVAFYPRLFIYGNNNQLEEHYKLTIFQLKIMTASIFLISFPFLIYSDWIIKLLFGSGWGPAASASAVLSLMVVLQAIERPLADNLTTKGQQDTRTVIMVIGFVIAIACYYFFGKTYGVMGGAVAAVTTEFSLVIMFVLMVKKGLKVLFKGIFFNAISYIITVAFTYFLLRSIFPILGMIIGGMIYVVLIILLDKEIRTQGQAFLHKKFKVSARE